MADKKISQLNALTTWSDDDEFAIVDTDLTETKKITAANVKANVLSGFITLPTEDVTLTAAKVANITGGCYIRLDTFGGAAAQDLDTITMAGGNVDGTILILCSTAAARDITVKDGVDNISLAGDFVLDNPKDTLMLIYRSTTLWTEISRSTN